MARTNRKKQFQDESVSTGRVVFGSEVLPQATRNRLQPSFTSEAARAMRFDAEAHAAVEYVLDAMLADGIETVGAAFETDPEFELAEEISAFVRRNLFEHCSFFLRTYKAQMRGAFNLGHKASEIVLRLETEGVDKGKLVLDRLKVKPNRSTAFVVDEFYNVLGLVAVRRGQTAITTGQISPENVIPLEKFVVCTFETEDEDPRGVSQISAAYDPFCDKKDTRAQFKVWRKKCAVRSFIATTAEKAQAVQVKNDDGTPKIVDGVPVTKTPAKAVSETLANMKNDTVAVFSFGTVVTPLDADGTGEQFERAYRINNQEIRKAILLQSGATGEADKGGLGKAGKEVDERVLNRRINSFRRDRELELYSLAKTLVELNYGRDKAHLTPGISLGDAEKSDFGALLAAYADVGYTLHESQFDEIDRKLGNPKRDMSQESNDADSDEEAEEIDGLSEDKE
jgi:hypothetical protein